MTGDDDGRAAIERVLAQPTLSAAFFAAVDEFGSRIAVREHGTPRELRFAEWGDAVAEVAGGLRALGVRRGDRVALLFPNDLDFHVADMGAVVLGAVPFSLYNSAPVDQLLENVDNAEPRVLIAAAELAEKAREIVRRRPSVTSLVIAEGATVLDPADAVAGEISLAELRRRGPADFDARAAAAAVRPDDRVTLVYTSGTTGPPKGVQYLHSGVMFAIRGFRQRLGVSPHGRVVAYLPMAHIAERLLGYYMGTVFGCTVTMLADLRQLVPALREVRPTRYFGVPRMYEKIDDAVRATLAEQLPTADRDALEAELAQRAERLAATATAPDPGALPDALRPSFELARRASGLDQAEWLIMSGAPCPSPLLLRFHALDLRVNEAYGGSENINASCNPPAAMRLGTAGLPYPGVELRLADDGEILLRGPNVTPGYLNDPERTREAIDDDGWQHTGDVGRLDEAGYLRIVDRKKDIIINSAGKNMSPTNIEAAIKLGAPLVAQVACIGDGRPYNVALIALDPDELRRFASDHGLAGAGFSDWAADPVVRAEVQAIVDRGNARLSRVEQIKRFHVIEREWLPGSDEITATGKLRRRTVASGYAERIDALYAQPREAAAGGARR